MPDRNEKLVYFTGIDNAKFRRPVVPGDRMVIEVEVVQRRSNIWKVAGQVSVDGNLCATAKLLTALTDKGDIPQGSGFHQG